MAMLRCDVTGTHGNLHETAATCTHVKTSAVVRCHLPIWQLSILIEQLSLEFSAAGIYTLEGLMADRA